MKMSSTLLLFVHALATITCKAYVNHGGKLKAVEVAANGEAREITSDDARSSTWDAKLGLLESVGQGSSLEAKGGKEGSKTISAQDEDIAQGSSLESKEVKGTTEEWKAISAHDEDIAQGRSEESLDIEPTGNGHVSLSAGEKQVTFGPKCWQLGEVDFFHVTSGKNVYTTDWLQSGKFGEYPDWGGECTGTWNYTGTLNQAYFDQDYDTDKGDKMRMRLQALADTNSGKSVACKEKNHVECTVIKPFDVIGKVKYWTEQTVGEQGVFTKEEKIAEVQKLKTGPF
eukprot:gnl/MRDRNA2_/MRDRNA2_28919_c0_seq1.p1 gnl/MRDRNA2_/MRDRNA2_28919_c0~~gnl/MRDRNA2_/MRDRNA2_28919_c0_seq1.p1  ORF type:complete len:285 (-),score=55.41 gnl/MRDRNA2_/MRDRNA2_28919_c0_seq1:582-1436(-)